MRRSAFVRASRSPLIAVVVLALAGCATTDVDPRELVARHELIEVNGQALPIDKGPLPGRDGRATPYHYVLARGHLDLRFDRVFEIAYEHINSESGAVLARTTQSGTWSGDGDRLLLEGVPQAVPSGRPNRWIGAIRAETITVRFNDERLTFRRIG